MVFRKGIKFIILLPYVFLLYTAGAVDIASISGVASSIFLFDILSLVIFSNPNISSNALIVFRLCHTVLFVHGVYYNCLFLPDGLYGSVA